MFVPLNTESREQNKTEQNRTDQKRTEQNSEEQNMYANESTAVYHDHNTLPSSSDTS